MSRLRLSLAAWAALLAAGFALVLILGNPVRTAAEELDAALHPTPPVTRQAASDAASTIVRLQYPAFEGIAPSIGRATDFGVEHWVIEYTDRAGTAPRGLRVSIGVASGQVEVNSFP